ncbi:unnamed protein product [Periconia digitata]|uniref:RNA helicase n=1 Tax=Periconia digitata TaxID=1303443 RepID=A0A9W4U8F1_9PLEO|nr:unnamed protein product [Periconia digitata]
MKQDNLKTDIYSISKMNSGNAQANKIDTVSEVVQPELNVYASSFIPEIYKDINRDGGVVVDIDSKICIDYSRYIQSFVGFSFVPSRLPKPNQHLFSASNRQYLRHMRALWDVEKAAKLLEDEGHSLYRVLLGARILDDQRFLTLQIPGLRENSPSVEIGDTIQLRPLFVDSSGNLTDVYMHFNYPDVQMYPRHWTGTIWNASVHYVHRASETVYLKADDLRETWIANFRFELYVNVVFPPKSRHLKAAHEALVLIDTILTEIDASEGAANGAWEQHTRTMSVTNGASGGQDPPLNSQKSASSPQIEAIQRPNSWTRRILFPEESDGQWQRQLRRYPDRKLFDPQLNYEQVQAVNSVCKNDYGILPYCISGPPGTGKTKTLVELAMQLLEGHTVDHILICAPSDQAADTLALRLKKYLTPTQLLRLIGPSRAENEVPLELVGTGYTYSEDGMFYIPPFQQLMKYNVVVTSCRDASILMQARITNADLWAIEQSMLQSFRPEQTTPSPSLHFGALLVDEAAQAVELDLLPAISVVCPPAAYPSSMQQPRFVMAGDEKQLGPQTASRDPRFSRSLFARLFTRPLYQNHPLSRSNMKPSTHPPVLTKDKLPILYPPFANLTRNYRSHPAIISIPSCLFYNDTLIPEKKQLPPPPSSTPTLQTSPLFNHGKTWPVLFVPNTSPDEIERENGGWYNVGEAILACNIASHLLSHAASLPQSSICIMSPFAAQVRRIRALLRSSAYNLRDVNVGPVEAFQGLEKEVVILCTTRSRAAFLDSDIKRGLGVVGFPRKMNVAITRAKEALFVLGHPGVLGTDEVWRQWMGFCARNGLVYNHGGSGGEVLGAMEGVGGEVASGAEEGMKIGVLERALVAKGRKMVEGKEERVLGGAMDMGMMQLDDGGYEAWVEGLREALEEEEETDGIEYEEEGEQDDGAEET